MRIDFRVDWGYVYLYSYDEMHPVYIWDGNLKCDKGEIAEIYQLDYPFSHYGVIFSAKETRLEKPEWHSRTQRRLSGIRVVADVEDDSTFTLSTRTGTFCFSVEELLSKGRVEFPVAPKYLGCAVTVTLTNHLWYRPQPKPEETILEADAFGLEVYERQRMKIGWMGPGQSAVFPVNVLPTDSDYVETLIQIVGMAAPEMAVEDETLVANETLPFALYCDGQLILEYSRYYREHDFPVQMMEDDWIRVQLEPGTHVLEIKNLHDEIALGIHCMVIKQCEYNHGQLSVPEWALKGETIIGKVFAVKEDVISVSMNNYEIASVVCQPGWNEFEVKSEHSGIIELSTATDKFSVEIFDCAEETYPVKVGYDMTVVPHDENGFMDWLIDYTYRTRLGNYICFRDFRWRRHTNPENVRRWGTFCKEHGIYVSASVDMLYEGLAASAGCMLSEAGTHEHSGTVMWWAQNFEHLGTDGLAKDMKEASEMFTSYLKKEIRRVRHLIGDENRVAFGDSGVGVKYSYLAGIDSIRAETMCGDSMALLSSVRGNSEALGDGRWGVHIAIQHYYTPYKETHLGQYFLALMQPWIMGAETIYEEDSLFLLFKEEKQTWRDALTKGKRDMTRSFYKFVKTHPRKGKLLRNLAVLEGRYAAPYNNAVNVLERKNGLWGYLCGHTPEWEYAQPEKYRHVLDVLTPGADVTPLRQRFDKKHIFFTGTPFGDYDAIPVEADANFYMNYKVILNLGWNTMIEEDYSKLKQYVENGGILLTGVPQFSTHVSRKFLADMQDLSLWNGGDLRDLCGVIVEGRGEEYCGQWMCAARETMSEPELSSMPTRVDDEDGPAMLATVELCGAQVVAWDTASGKPMLVRNRVGLGWVYTFTIWAYPGHEKFQKFCACWTEYLAKSNMSETYVVDVSGEVFWNVWETDNGKIVKMLNTDWTTKGNIKTVKIVSEDVNCDVDVQERTLVFAVIRDGNVEVETFSL